MANMAESSQSGDLQNRHQSAIHPRIVLQSGERHGWEKLRVRYAKLSYRQRGDREDESWEDLEDSYVLLSRAGGQKEKLPERWNVEQIELSGDGLMIHQYGAEYQRSSEAKAGGKGTRILAENEFSWCVNFQNDKMSDIRINEGMRPRNSEPFVEIRFAYNGKPDSSDSTELMEPDEGDLEREEEAEAEEGEEVEGEEQAGDEDEEEEEEEPDPVPQDFPLAKVFAEGGKAENLEFRLAFKRSGQGKLNPYRWYWDAAVYFLAGGQKWNATKKTQNPPKTNTELQLDPWLKAKNGQVSFATLTSSKGPYGDNLWWALHRRGGQKPRSQQPATPPSSDNISSRPGGRFPLSRAPISYAPPPVRTFKGKSEDDEELEEVKQKRKQAEAEFSTAESKHKETTVRIEELKREVRKLESEELVLYDDMVAKRRKMRDLRNQEEDLATRRRRTDS